MRKILLVLALCAMAYSHLSGQIINRKFSGYDNPNHHLREAIEGGGKCVAITKAGEVYVAATTQIPDSGITVALIKFASDGKIEWTKTMKEFYLGSDQERTYVPMAIAL